MNRFILKNDWKSILEEEFTKPYYKSLIEFLKREYETEKIYPNKNDVLNALHYTPFENVQVVILGQDPYHGSNQAHGLSFSVKKGVKKPPSLVNIFKELESDLGFSIPKDGSLVSWANQGVLLLNNVLTVRAGQAHSHQGKGWEIFTDRIISLLNGKDHPIIYLLWGRAAQNKQELIDTEKHYIISSPHPSPFSAHRGFFGSKPFSTTNQILEKEGLQPIHWDIED